MGNLNKFSGENSSNLGEIMCIKIEELYPPEFHPFNVEDNDELQKLAESIRENGVTEPCIARKRDEGGFELLCGNRRKMACEMLGIEILPVIVRELDDKQAVDVQVDSNLLHRERILPSEKAWAYCLKMETLNHNGKKSEKHSHEILTEQTGESKNQIFRYIRLTELVPDLMDKVDERKIAFNPAVELSYLSRSEQNIVNTAIEKYDTKPTLSQAIKIRKLSQEQKLNAETVEKILSESINETPKIEKYRKFFPSEYTPKQIDNVIVKLLKNWQKSQLSTA